MDDPPVRSQRKSTFGEINQKEENLQKERNISIKWVIVVSMILIIRQIIK